MPSSTDMTSDRRRISVPGSRTLAAFGSILIASLIAAWAPPVDANVFGKLGKMYGCVVTWGQVCDLSDTVVGTGPVPQPIPVTCTAPLLTGLPQFLTAPKGQAKYRFQSICTSPAKPGASMTVQWEGTWSPSESRADRPNASESLTLSGFESFLPDRAAGGTIFMYWTARCTRDPWLQSPACTPYGAFVPDDLRQALPDIDQQTFPRTAAVISPADKRRLTAEYLRVNPPTLKLAGALRNSSPANRPDTSSAAASAATRRGATLGKRLRTRGVEREDRQDRTAVSSPEAQELTESGASAEERADRDTETAPVTIALDQPLHVFSMEGKDQILEPGVYEIEPLLDLQLSLAREGRDTVILPAVRSAHHEPLSDPVALLAPGEANDTRHIVFLNPDGKRFEVAGSTTGIRSRGTEEPSAIDDGKLHAAVNSPPPSGDREQVPACRPNPLPVGPRFIPTPCTMETPSIAAPAEPYVDDSHMLHACVNNNEGSFHIVRASDTCLTDEGEIKIKWQLVP